MTPPENQGFSLLDDTGSVVDISDANNPRPIIDPAGGVACTFTIRYEPTGGNDTDGVLTILQMLTILPMPADCLCPVDPFRSQYCRSRN